VEIPFAKDPVIPLTFVSNQEEEWLGTIDESKAARKLMLEKKKQGTDSSKVPVTVKDVNGRAFTIMIDSTQVSSPSPTPEFAGLAADPVPMATIDEVEYEGWLVIEEPVTSVNWNEHHAMAVDDAFTVESSNRLNHSQTPLMDFPCIVDTGTTVHISPDRSDFLHLYPIQLRSVKGIGGSSITAIGVSDVKLKEARGASITLCNVLYIPNATVHLISVGSLAEDSNAIAHFDSSSCWITNKSTGILIAQGP
jgi:hypothetical protein